VSDDMLDPDAVVDLPIDGVLDLHPFAPRDVKRLLAEYLPLCRERGILEVRIIHGKGSGALRRTVHALLKRSVEVASFHTPTEADGGWGATLVRLVPLASGGPSP
jgi:DNA-nicking Smr family endonuclease